MDPFFDIFDYMDFDYLDYYGYGASMAGGMLSVFLGFYLLIFFVSIAFSLLSYILQSLGLQAIANRRGIQNGWLAWLPIGNLWVIGSISDQYRYVAKGKVTNRRKLLLGMTIAMIAIYIIWVILLVATVAISFASYGASMGTPVLMLFFLLLFVIIAVVISVLQYMCMYDLYCSCVPENGTLYLVLSILVSWLTPFLVFACRNKDQGMPPRRQPIPQPETYTYQQDFTTPGNQ